MRQLQTVLNDALGTVRTITHLRRPYPVTDLSG